MQVTISDLKLLDSLIVALDELKPSDPHRVWIRLYKGAIEQRFIPPVQSTHEVHP